MSFSCLYSWTCVKKCVNKFLHAKNGKQIRRPKQILALYLKSLEVPSEKLQHRLPPPPCGRRCLHENSQLKEIILQKVFSCICVKKCCSSLNQLSVKICLWSGFQALIMCIFLVVCINLMFSSILAGLCTVCSSSIFWNAHIHFLHAVLWNVFFILGKFVIKEFSISFSWGSCFQL